MKEAFSKANSPIWMDSSTKKQCQALTNYVGGAQNLSNITGSSSYERFSINQIMKFSEDEEKWSQTESVSLISSFVVSILIGSYAPIDFSDGSGMNILDIKKGFQIDFYLMTSSANQTHGRPDRGTNSVESVVRISGLRFFSGSWILSRDSC